MTGTIASLAMVGGAKLDWYLTRSTGAVALVLLTFAVALGVADVRRWSTPRWPRFVVDSLHRSVSLLAVAFLALHVVTAVLDSFAPISLAAAMVPFVSPYRPFWLGLGAIALDLLLAVTITSLLRRRIGHAGWRATHWLAYACWPIALLHTLGTGSDIKDVWLLALSVACLALVVAAVLVRSLAGYRSEIARGAGIRGRGADMRDRSASMRGRGLAIGGTAAFALGVLLWLPSGPLGSEWARRSGTPAALLGHSGATGSGAEGHR